MIETVELPGVVLENGDTLTIIDNRVWRCGNPTTPVPVDAILALFRSIQDRVLDCPASSLRRVVVSAGVEVKSSEFVPSGLILLEFEDGTFKTVNLQPNEVPND